MKGTGIISRGGGWARRENGIQETETGVRWSWMTERYLEKSFIINAVQESEIIKFCPMSFYFVQMCSPSQDVSIPTDILLQENHE